MTHTIIIIIIIATTIFVFNFLFLALGTYIPEGKKIIIIIIIIIIQYLYGALKSCMSVVQRNRDSVLSISAVEDKSENYQNCSVLFCTTLVHNDMHIHVSTS